MTNGEGYTGIARAIVDGVLTDLERPGQAWRQARKDAVAWLFVENEWADLLCAAAGLPIEALRRHYRPLVRTWRPDVGRTNLDAYLRRVPARLRLARLRGVVASPRVARAR